jgi:hypothetical protein
MENNILLNIKNNERGFIVSLGEFCITATLLKDLKCRTESFPFDWIFSNVSFIQDCLINDFKPLFDIIKSGDTEGKIIYENTRFKKISIPHKNLNDPETLKYYERRVTNFMKMFKSDFKKLFVHISGNINDQPDYDKLNDLCKTIETQGCTNFNIITISFTADDIGTWRWKLYHEQNQVKHYIINPYRDIKFECWQLNIGFYKDQVQYILEHNHISFNVINTKTLINK